MSLPFLPLFASVYTSLTRWTWVWVSSRSWWWTGRPGVLRFTGSQRVGHDWATALNWTDTLLISQTCSHVLCLPFLFFCLMDSYLWAFVYSVHSTLNVLSPIFSVKILPKLKSSWHATSPTKPFLAPAVRSKLPEHLHHYSPTLQHISLTPLPLLLFSCQIVSDCVNPWTAACQASLSFTISWSLPKFRSIELVMLSNHLILCHLLLLLPSIFTSIRVFSDESTLRIRWPKYWSFSFSINPSNECSRFISFRIDWVLSPCSPRDSQGSSPVPQFERINSLVLNLLYGSAFMSIHNYWKNHSFDYADLCWQTSPHD